MLELYFYLYIEYLSIKLHKEIDDLSLVYLQQLSSFKKIVEKNLNFWSIYLPGQLFERFSKMEFFQESQKPHGNTFF